MISCDKVQSICTKAQYREASFYEKGLHFIHTLYCKACIEFSRKNNHLTGLLGRTAAATLTEAEKKAMKQRLGQAG